MKFIGVDFQANRMDEMKHFYTELLGFLQTEQSDDHFAFQAGRTSVRFTRMEPDSVAPFYHFAFSIPENKYDEARTWMENRVPLVLFPEEDGTVSSEVHFPHWNAHSFYFLDPDQNIVEMIARHDLQNQQQDAFHIGQVLGIDEIGLPVADVPNMLSFVQKELGVVPWRPPTQTFAPVGDQEGLFIFVQEGRIWFGTQREATASPVRITILGEKDQEICVPQTPYSVMIGRKPYHP
ncbi:VOC family protein [Brevibacillus panacihumi]|uniref:VOC family protein n=1 Tax=Brevibacillus panacihumi TaxID=497735 RepID=UPI003D06E27B